MATLDSASALVRATSRALCGLDFADLGLTGSRTWKARWSGWLPPGWRQRAAAQGTIGSALPPDWLGEVDLEAVAAWLTDHYSPGHYAPGHEATGHEATGPFSTGHNTGSDYPGLVIGSSNGALAHLCVATGMPFLPQTVLVPVRRHDNDPDDAIAALEFGREVAPPLLERNPGVVLSQQHDANQDRSMVSRMTYFRLKWTTLPTAYETFIRTRLQPGAPIVIFADRSAWPVTKVSERHVFQAGGHGGIAPEDFLDGSSRVTEFLRAQGSPRSRFACPEPDGQEPEAEWGYHPALTDPLLSLAEETGHPVLLLQVPWPQVLAWPVAELMRRRLRAAGGSGNRLLIESYVMQDPVQALRAGAVPYWTFLGVQPGRHAATRYLAAVAEGETEDPYDEVRILLYPHGVASCGTASPDEWRTLAEHVTGPFGLVPGTEQRWPTHFDALTRYGPWLRSWSTELSEPLPIMPVEEALESIAGGSGGSGGLGGSGGEVELSRLR